MIAHFVSALPAVLRCLPMLACLMLVALLIPPAVPVWLQILVLAFPGTLYATGAGLSRGEGGGAALRMIFEQPRHLRAYLAAYAVVAAPLVIAGLGKAAIYAGLPKQSGLQGQIQAALWAGSWLESPWVAASVLVVVAHLAFQLPQALERGEILPLEAWELGRDKVANVILATLVPAVAVLLALKFSRPLLAQSYGITVLPPPLLVFLGCLACAVFAAALAAAYAGPREEEALPAQHSIVVRPGEWSRPLFPDTRGKPQFGAAKAKPDRRQLAQVARDIPGVRVWLDLAGGIRLLIRCSPALVAVLLAEFALSLLGGPAWPMNTLIHDAIAWVVLPLPLVVVAAAEPLDDDGWAGCLGSLQPGQLVPAFFAAFLLLIMPWLTYQLVRAVPPSFPSFAPKGGQIAAVLAGVVVTVRLGFLVPQVLVGRGLDFVAAWQAGHGSTLPLIGAAIKFGLFTIPLGAVTSLVASLAIRSHPSQAWALVGGPLLYVLFAGFVGGAIGRAYAQAIAPPFADQ